MAITSITGRFYQLYHSYIMLYSIIDIPSLGAIYIIYMYILYIYKSPDSGSLAPPHPNGMVPQAHALGNTGHGTIHTYMHTCMHACMHASIHPSIRMHPSTHPSIHPSIHPVKNTIVLISTISIVYMATMHSTICALDQGLEPKTIARGKQYS